MDESELLVQEILKVLSFKFSRDRSPVGALYWYDKHDFNADQWGRIEERLLILLKRVQKQRSLAEEAERRAL